MVSLLYACGIIVVTVLDYEMLVVGIVKVKFEIYTFSNPLRQSNNTRI